MRFWTRMAILIIMVVLVFAGSVTLLFLTSGCPPKSYPGVFQNVTSYKLNDVKWRKTTRGTSVWAPPTLLTQAFLNTVDKKTSELEECLKKSSVKLRSSWKIQRTWFAIYVPNDWYVSPCSKEQLIPSKVDYKLCEKKGLTIQPRCREVVKPTAVCPCPCNVRSTVQDNWVIVTEPSLKLFKMSLARIIFYPRYVLNNTEITRCLW